MKNSENINEVQEPDMTGSYTALDYLSWKTDELMELIRGKVYKMAAAPSTRHQIISSELNDILKHYFKSPCTVLYAPCDVYLIHKGEKWKETKNIVQPDLCVICEPNMIHDRGCIGSPDLVVEILSPSTAKKDLGLKRELYEEYGVKEMWIVHPNDGTVVVHVLENGKYRILPMVGKGQMLQSPTFPDLYFNLDEVFTEPDS